MSGTKCSNSLELSKFTETSTIPDFTFIIDNCKYKCKTIQICSISNVIFKQIPNFYLSDAELNDESLKNYDQNFIYNFNDIKQKSNSKDSGITCDKLKDPHHYFQLFLDAVEGKNITITKFNAFFLNYIANILQVDELKKATEPFLSFKLNPNNALQILFYFSESNIRNKEVINYVSSNWSQFDFPIETITNYVSSSNNQNQSDLSKLEKMLHLTYEFYNFVFSSQNFKPRSDEWLFHFIYLLVKKNKNSKDYRLLFKYVKFEKLTNISVDKIFKCIAIDSIPSGFIESIEQRFISNVDGNVLICNKEYDSEDLYYDYSEDDDSEIYENATETIHSEKKIKFPFKHEYNDLFKGVFSYFQQNNRFAKDVKSFCGGTKQQLLRHVFEYEKNIVFEYYWDSFNQKSRIDINNAWIVISFPNHQFKLKNYTIATSPQSREYKQDGVQPKSWIIEASNSVISAKSSLLDPTDADKAASEIEDAKWDLIAKEEDNKSLLSKNETIKTFGIEKNHHEFYRSFRFKMLKNQSTPDILWYDLLKLNAIEFYGTLIKCSKKKK